MRNLLVLSLALLACSAASAQEFFGYTSEDISAMIGKAKADEKLQRLKELGHEPSRWPSIGKAIGTTRTLQSRQDCIIDAVTARMGVTIRPDTEWPTVLAASETDFAKYQAAVKAQYPAKKADAFETIYLSDYEVIYLQDSAGAYKGGATMDDALAGEYARFLDYTQKDVRDPAQLDADAAAVRAWYRAAYPSGTTSCSR
ncbi:MAG: hypothetical protein HY079_10760 [Elusimicrobia bacterium]|nr:hypothetical protein [Elusimicrobiota bacterium]